MKVSEQVNQEYQGEEFKNQDLNRRFFNQSMLDLQKANPILDSYEDDPENQNGQNDQLRQKIMTPNVAPRQKQNDLADDNLTSADNPYLRLNKKSNEKVMNSNPTSARRRQNKASMKMIR